MESRAYDNYYDPIYVGPNTDNRNNISTSSVDIAQGRFKYFRRPPDSWTNTTANFALSDEYPTDDEAEDSDQQTKDIDILPNVRDACVQTMYRETECQTEPYCPDYSVKVNSQPDILLVDKVFDIKQSSGIHITTKDVRRILELKSKKELYDSLPPFTDEMSMLLRKRLLEDQELHEMGMHIEEIDERRELKLKELIVEIDETQLQKDSEAAERLEKMRLTKLQQQESKIEVTQKTIDKALRQIARKREMDPYAIKEGTNNLSTSYNKKDLLKTYMSQTAPPTTTGKTAQTDNIDYNYSFQDDSVFADEEETFSKLDILNKAINVNDKVLDETMHLSKPSTMKKDIQFLPKILVPKKSNLTIERVSSSKLKAIQSTQKQLDSLNALLQKEKLLHSQSAGDFLKANGQKKLPPTNQLNENSVDSEGSSMSVEGQKKNVGFKS